MKCSIFYFCYITTGEADFTYVLILKEDRSGFVQLHACKTAAADETAKALLAWQSTFGTVSTWVSGKETHFNNELVSKLAELTKIDHYFTIAYCPWSNGTVEVVCQELLRAMRALLF